MGITELIRQVRAIADVGIVNARHDQAVLREAADRLEEMEERLAIIGEPGAVIISRPLNAQEREAVWQAFKYNKPIYASIERIGDQFSIQEIAPLGNNDDLSDKQFSGLIEEE